MTRRQAQDGGTVNIGIVGATGQVGVAMRQILLDRDFPAGDVRFFASSRSAGTQLGRFTVEEATPEALSRGDVDLFLFSVGTSASRELVPHAVDGGAVAIDKSSAYRLDPRYPLVVPEVNAVRATGDIIANPNCCTIPLTCVLKPLHDAVGLTRVRIATYQSVPAMYTGENALSVFFAPSFFARTMNSAWLVGILAFTWLNRSVR